jgi:Ca2+:H+ antiporter
MNWLLVFVPAAVLLRYLRPEWHTAIFVVACLAIIPLAGWLGKATQHLAERSGEAIGGLLNATFGNAAELIIALVALHDNLQGVVKASLTGSIVGNLLLVLGMSLLAGGIRRGTQRFNARSARVQSTMLILAAVALIAPAVYHHLAKASGSIRELSLEISVVLLISYGLNLWFVLGSGQGLSDTHGASQRQAQPEKGGTHTGLPQTWSVARSVAVLAGSTASVAWMSEILVGSVEMAAESLGMNSIFVGVVIVGVIGNAAEHSTAVTSAMRNQMDLSLAIAVGSSIQIALFVAPVLVLASYVIAPQPMNLVFTSLEVLAIVVSIVVAAQIAGDGESNWLEGAQLIAVYVILALVFYFLPEARPAAHAR